MSHTLVFGFRVPVGPECCGHHMVLFRQEPVAEDDTKTRQHFRCAVCQLVSDLVVSDEDRWTRSHAMAFICLECGHPAQPGLAMLLQRCVQPNW